MTTQHTARLVSYNIMAGGEGRADPIAEVILGQRADVVGIHEADDRDVLRRLAWRLKMDFVVGEANGGRVALFSRFGIIDSTNLSALHRSTMPILDVQLAVGHDGSRAWAMTVRVAFMNHLGEADRMADRLATTSSVRAPHAMLMSYEPPIGQRVVDGQIVPSVEPLPDKTHAPPRQLDQVMIRPGITTIDEWIMQDRLAYYASDHLPTGAEIVIGE